MQSMSLEEVKAHLVEIIRECVKQTEAKPRPLDLQRGYATIPQEDQPNGDRSKQVGWKVYTQCDGKAVCTYQGIFRGGLQVDKQSADSQRLGKLGKVSRG